MADTKINTQSEKLFQVRPDLPPFEALEKAQCYLEAASEIGHVTATNQDGKGAWAVTYLIDAAKTLLDQAVDKYSAETPADAVA